MNKSIKTQYYLVGGLVIGLLVGFISLSYSNLILGIVSIIGWLFFMAGIPEKDSSVGRVAVFYSSLTLLPISWGLYIWLK